MSGESLESDQRPPSPDDRARGIAARVREVCEGRTAAEVACATGTNPETTRRYLAGLSAPSAVFLAALCEAYGVAAEWLLLGKGEKTGAAAPATSVEAVRALAGVMPLIEARIAHMERLAERISAARS